MARSDELNFYYYAKFSLYRENYIVRFFSNSRIYVYVLTVCKWHIAWNSRLNFNSDYSFFFNTLAIENEIYCS